MMNTDDLKRVVLDTAREMYARQGYVNTTVKGVAAAAGVAPDLVRRYYASREELFAAAMRLPTDPATAVAQLLAPGIDGLAERLVRVTFQLLDEPETREQIAAMVRAGTGAAQGAAPLREFLESVIIDRVASALRVPDARMRVALAISYVVGIVGSRYVLRMEPLASATEDEVVRLVVPAVQTALAGPA
ncbi:MAG: TetR family transcriptional regulator [Mycobacterium sp.]|nr:TetR family transcriptional regulator [Mycobacterium sp.]